MQPIEVTHRWAASVGFTDDGRPLCVEVDDGVMAVGGYSGTGNLVGPVAARAAVAWLVNKTPRTRRPNLLGSLSLPSRWRDLGRFHRR